MSSASPSPPSPADLPTVAVRTLCGFTARRGDLDLRFTPSPTAAQGIAGHQRVAARRGEGWQAEVALEGTWRDSLRLRGRADGFDPVAGRLEEVKTHRGDLARQPAHHRHLHWAQLKVYGALLCRSRGLDSVRLALVYLDLRTDAETVFEETHDAAALEAFLDEHCGLYLDWARREQAHRRSRDAALAGIAFPHPDFRPGQRELAAAVWRAARDGRCLLAQAPTGIGKTLGTLFPLLKAMPAQRLDRVFFLSAKTPGRQLALDALAPLRAAGPLPLRTLELVARDKACEHPDKACHGEACPLAAGFYDRLPAARDAALAAPLMDRAAVRQAALDHEVCPYWLGQELARWADLVVGDYNHFYDGSAVLHALAQEQEWRCAVLVDEAHNLVERGRQMYSAALDPFTLRSARRGAPAALKSPLQKLARAWREVEREAQADYEARDELPAGLLRALAQATAAIADALAGDGDGPPAVPDAALQQLHFDLLAFGALAERFGDHSVFDLTRASHPPAARGGPSSLLSIRNLLPAPHLAPRFAAAQATVLFSATLGPADFCRDNLGLPANAAWLEVGPPFQAAQLDVRLVPRISTRWADRAASVAPIADLVAAQYRRQPGNYLAFFSSFAYLDAVAQRLAQDHPDVPAWSQSPRMDEAERAAFLARFTPGGRGVGFAVLGGAFAEGVDLPGDRLVGAFVATLGLPQVNPVNELLRRRLQRAFGRGFDDAYLYPGLRKVVQAAGRVIRTPQDRGVVYLIDDRFCRPGVRALLPSWWQPRVCQ